MKALKKWAPLAAIVATALALILYVFAPVLTMDMMGMTSKTSVWDSLKDEKVPMIIVTVLLVIASVVMAVMNYLKNNEKINYAAAAVMVVTAIFCFSSKAFILSDQDIPSAMAKYFDLGIGAILAGILLIVSAAAVMAPKFLKDKE